MCLTWPGMPPSPSPYPPPLPPNALPHPPSSPPPSALSLAEKEDEGAVRMFNHLLLPACKTCEDEERLMRLNLRHLLMSHI